MHGIIFSELKRYAGARLGADGWESLLTAAKLSGKAYVISEPYPDSEALALVGAASQLVKLPVAVVLEDFGRFITPTLMSVYGRLLQPQWRSLEVIENAEATIHTVVRLRNKGATPPVLKVQRASADELTVVYASPRKLCHLAVGIVHGIGEHFQEILTVQQKKCMHLGGPHCEIAVEREAVRLDQNKAVKRP